MQIQVPYERLESVHALSHGMCSFYICSLKQNIPSGSRWRWLKKLLKAFVSKFSIKKINKTDRLISFDYTDYILS